VTAVPVTPNETCARIGEVLGALVHERQELRRQKARPSNLEANRLAIVYWQQRLARQLVDERPGSGRASRSS
jgi:hypothetical protein